MSVQADEAPEGGEEEPVRKDALPALAREELSEVVGDSPLASHKYIAKLFCGCIVTGETRARYVRVGSHGRFCEEHEEFSFFEDFISTRPLTHAG